MSSTEQVSSKTNSEEPLSNVNEQKRKSSTPKGSLNGKKLTVHHAKKKGIELTEDYFGTYVDDGGTQHKIHRFTWANHNNIKVQLITYGARITSLILPNRKGVAEDVLMGFDDLAGYLHYEDLHAGGIIGRITNRIKNGTFAINNKQYWLSLNDEPHHSNGGFRGLDKVVWIPYVVGAKVILSYISNDLDEGYPGDLLIRSTYELTPKNEFSVEMEAMTTKATIVNLSNLLYFNLGGHGAGPEELYKHMITINSNCFVPLKEDGLPSGEIFNVIHSRNDFQIPKLLKKEMETPESGFDVHLCINRGMNEDVSFVARALHPPSGRILEIYSNQSEVHFSTVNELNVGLRDLPVVKQDSKMQAQEEGDAIFDLINRLHEGVAETLSMDSKTDYSELKELIRKLHKRKFSYGSQRVPSEILSPEGDFLEDKKSLLSELSGVKLNPLQVNYLEAMMETSKTRNSLPNYSELEEIIRKLLDSVTAKTELEMYKKSVSLDVAIKNESQLRSEEVQEQLKQKLTKEASELKRKGMTKVQNNKIPSFYKDGRLHGKNNAIYKRHGFICFQTQNYPNAIYHKNFPNCELHPGETYKHKTVYKFWLQSGNPSKWLKRNCP